MMLRTRNARHQLININVCKLWGELIVFQWLSDVSSTSLNRNHYFIARVRANPGQNEKEMGTQVKTRCCRVKINKEGIWACA